MGQKSSDIYELYKDYCSDIGREPLPNPNFFGAVKKAYNILVRQRDNERVLVMQDDRKDKYHI